jgi:CRP/FNR family cyclic AMP-dependent transcriptional regulator
MALNELQEMAQEWKFKSGDILWGRRIARRFFVVLQGSVKVELEGNSNRNGQKVLLYVLGPGEFFGQAGLLSRSTDSCIVTAADSGQALLFSARPFLSLAERYPGVLLKMLRELQSRLYKSHQRISRFLFADAYEKVASVLVEFIDRQNGSARKGQPLNIELLPRRDWASMAGVRRETFARTLSAFQRAGLIRVEGQMIAVLNPTRLRREASRSQAP